MGRRLAGGTHRLDLAVSSLYGELTEGRGFIEAVGQVASSLGCHLSGLHQEDVSTGKSVIEITGSAGAGDVAKLVDEYSRHWQGQNKWLHRGLKLMERYGFGDGDDCVTESELSQMPYYTKFLAPLDIRHGIAFLLRGTSKGEVAVLSFNRSRSAGCFTASEKGAFPALLSHFRSAYRVADLIHSCCTRVHELESALGAAETAVAQVLWNMELLHFNEAGRHALEAIGVSRVRVGVALVFRDRRDGAAIVELVSKALRTGVRQGPLLIRTQVSDKRRFAIDVAPMGAESGRVCTSAFLVIRCMSATEPDQRNIIRLRSAFGLTAAEATTVENLRTTGSLEQACAMLGISLATGRSHVQHAFVKMDVHKQTDLVLLAERLMNRAPGSS